MRLVAALGDVPTHEAAASVAALAEDNELVVVHGDRTGTLERLVRDRLPDRDVVTVATIATSEDVVGSEAIRFLADSGMLVLCVPDGIDAAEMSYSAAALARELGAHELHLLADGWSAAHVLHAGAVIGSARCPVRVAARQPTDAVAAR